MLLKISNPKIQDHLQLDFPNFRSLTYRLATHYFQARSDAAQRPPTAHFSPIGTPTPTPFTGQWKLKHLGLTKWSFTTPLPQKIQAQTSHYLLTTPQSQHSLWKSHSTRPSEAMNTIACLECPNRLSKISCLYRLKVWNSKKVEACWNFRHQISRQENRQTSEASAWFWNLVKIKPHGSLLHKR